jgi:hypothetical protein
MDVFFQRRKNACAPLRLLLAVLFYAAAIINGDNGNRTVWLALGAMFLCFGMRNGRKVREAAKENENAE